MSEKRKCPRCKGAGFVKFIHKDVECPGCYGVGTIFISGVTRIYTTTNVDDFGDHDFMKELESL